MKTILITLSAICLVRCSLASFETGTERKSSSLGDIEGANDGGAAGADAAESADGGNGKKDREGADGSDKKGAPEGADGSIAKVDDCDDVEPLPANGASAANVVVGKGSDGRICVGSSKDLSNVVVEYDDGSRERWEGLSGQTGVFPLALPEGKTVKTIWVKAGSNHSGDGPGYGARMDF